MAAKKASTKSKVIMRTDSMPKGSAGHQVESPTTGETSPVFRADMGESLPPQGKLLNDKK